MELRRHVFIGSSREGRDIAEELQRLLREDAACTVWHQGVFGLSEGTLESLAKKAKNFDFAVLVLTPDDLAITRGRIKNSARDNVIFEFGLFVGALGREATFGVFEENRELHLPTDLAGVTLSGFTRHQNQSLRAALGPVRLDIKEAIARHEKKVDVHQDGMQSAGSITPAAEKYFATQLRDNLESLHLSLENVMTFTQQISRKLIRAVDNVEQMAGDLIPREFSNDGRLSYARGVYAIACLAAHPVDQEIHLKRAIAFLTDSQKYLPRDATMRLSQAYRQAGQLIKSREVLEKLEQEEISSIRSRGEVLAIWSKALISLQEGLGSASREHRRAAFFEAAELLQPIFAERFGWDPAEDDDDLPETDINNGSIAYYTAKAMWAYRCTFSQHGEAHRDAGSPFTEDFQLRLQRASDLALRLYCRGRELCTWSGDSFVRAIYEHCVAFIIAVRTALPEIDQTAVFRKEVRRGQDSLRRARQSTQELLGYPTTLPRVIYVEGVERLGSLEEFQRDNDFVEEVFRRSEALFEFYSGTRL